MAQTRIVVANQDGRLEEFRIIPIDLTRPRDITSPQFNALKRHVLQLLRGERAAAPLEEQGERV